LHLRVAPVGFALVALDHAVLSFEKTSAAAASPAARRCPPRFRLGAIRGSSEAVGVQLVARTHGVAKARIGLGISAPHN
jgi:hypothetical protein